MPSKCMACGKLEAEKHHFKTRGSGGGDEDYNILWLCRFHHTEIHKIGNNKFVEKYPPVSDWLVNNGWELDRFLKKWKRYVE